MRTRAVAQLADVNLLLALVTDRHVHHPEAARWIGTIAAGEAIICRMAQVGLLRLLNNPAVMQEDTLTTDDCWVLWRHLTTDARIRVEAGEPSGLEDSFEEFTRGRRFSPRLWTDAYLAAYARAGHHTLVTLDHGFRQFTGLRCAILLADAG